MSVPLTDQATTILRTNDRGGYTVPTAGLYPYQWNWDSAFAALGFAAFDRHRAWRELETIFDGQWADGMAPHIIFRKFDPSYFPGPNIWGSRTDPPSSGHSQPPVVATIARWLVETGNADDEKRARALFPKLIAWHHWFHRARDPDQTGLVSIIHPWESGRDNCPDWDLGMNRMTVPNDLGDYHRRDTDWVDADERPTHETYDRYLTILKFGRECGWDHTEVYRNGPFLMADPCVQFVLMRADRDLLALAERFGETEAVPMLQGWIDQSRRGADLMWSDTVGGYVAREMRTGELSTAITNASVLAFYAGAGTSEQRATLIEQARQIADQCRYVFPSWDPRADGFESRRYWRGPVWSVMNWMIARGFSECGYDDLAHRVQRDTLAMVVQSGFFEYFDPLSGEGLGGPDFTWTAAIHLALQAEHGAQAAA